MSRTRKSNADDSLELLLDTVSNVFGGVMFLILLAALMTLTQSAIKDAPITDEADVDQSTPELMLEFATLRETKRLQQQLLSGYQATPAAMVTLRDLAHQQIQLQEIEAAQQAAAEKSARLQTALANTSAALKRLQSEATQQRRQHR